MQSAKLNVAASVTRASVLLAHSENREGNAQALEQHLSSVADAAAEFAEVLNARRVGWAVGWFHDLGKFHPEFQDYLHGRRPSGGDHKLAGAFALRAFLPAAMAVYGHHGGMIAARALKAKLAEAAECSRVAKAIELAGIEPLAAEISDHPAWLRNPLACEMYTRMIFSTLVDADFLDTEAHFSPTLAQRRASPALRAGEFFATLNAFVHGLAKGSPAVRQLRREVYEACVGAASLQPGGFRLTVPTGGGKTLASMAFALRHAETHGLRRVVVAIPYTSIIEQTADVYRQIFGDGVVLEHHSAVNDAGDEPGSWARLASENWDAPIIVTTTVQLFESLFASRTSRCRKLHNLARSVIVLDEVQTLPAHLLDPILDVLQELGAHYGASVVLSSATQPAFENSNSLRGLDDIREIVPQYRRLFATAKRVEYENAGEMTFDQTAAMVRQYPQALVIVNTKKDAMALLDLLPGAKHLSTQMCGAHRRAALAEIRDLLAAGRHCHLIATQVVEAGVDLDFPFVMRALGPLDRVVQAAGRCNREGRPELGRVVVFVPKDAALPRGVYRSATDVAAPHVSDPRFNWHDPDAYTNYFRAVYDVVDVSAREIRRSREALDFPETARLFHMIDDEGVPVVVRYGPARDQIEALLEQIRQRRGSPRELMRKLQPYVVNVNRRNVEKYRAAGWLAEVSAGLGLYEWWGKYDEVRGAVADPRDPEDNIL